mmetsp:Transcript_99613/g.175548  ORF Transcript_99613/g.175548 Transcript_99613/m.175548 type:complete len:1090 (-) Transcript_99613:79-3348(-)
MSSGTKRAKKKKTVKQEPIKKKEPEIVTCRLADNTYTGIIREGQLGAQYLECTGAKYAWKSGIKYEGPFSGSQIEGRGKFEWPDGSSYDGELKCGKRHGQGVYVASDGVTRYEGQWSMGKRHGEGKLIYSADGTSYYEGAWKDGKKHGQGHQVWPSGNSYEGQWEDGKMRGHGAMTWCVSGQVEKYVGNWEDNHPHGEGTHTWHAPEPKADQGSKDATSQQMNNSYAGQWQKGQRHGAGTFRYANGAYYQGEWKDHVKEGKGRHVFEDGRIYAGPFEQDNMTEYQASDKNSGSPYFGNEHNPVRRCIDISDIEVFANPKDCSGLESVIQPCYMETSKILREVYNTLLRNLGDLRELYYKYRILIPIPGEDPFVLSAHQMWLLARDTGLVTPSCSLTRLNRHVFKGPRHHREVAPDDMEDIRPLTPQGRRASLGQLQIKGLEQDQEEEEEEDEEVGSQEDEDSLASLAESSPKNAPMEAGESRRSASSPSMERLGSADSQKAAMPSVAEEAPVEGQLTRQETGEVITPSAPRSSRFKRPEGSNVKNVHAPHNHMLFRCFLEGIVRISLVRFPLERTMETQAQRMIRERINPNLDKEPASATAFAFLADPAFHKIYEEFKPRLLLLFRGGAVAEDYGDLQGPPSTPVSPIGHATGPDGAGRAIVRIRHYGDFGAPQHHLHVSARMDKTIRVKDMLRLLSSAGFLKPLKNGDIPWDELYSQVFASTADEDLLVLDEKEHQAYIEAQEQDSATESENDVGPRARMSTHGTAQEDDKNRPGRSLAFNSGFGGMGGFGGGGGLGGPSPGMGAMGGFGAMGAGMAKDAGGDKKDKKDSKNPGSRGRKGEGKDDDKGSKDADGSHLGDDKKVLHATAADFAQCDFTLTALQALRVLLEVAAPASVRTLLWQLGPQDAGILWEEHIPLLEFMENEMVFMEFVRMLLRMTDLGTRKDLAMCDRLSLPVRFEGFLRHVFLPALRAPYIPPAPEPEEKDEKASEVGRTSQAASREAASREETASKTEKVSEAEGEAKPEGEEGAEEEEEKEPEVQVPEVDPATLTVDLWAGFDDYSCAEAESMSSCRRWPEGYQEEVAAWV